MRYLGVPSEARDLLEVHLLMTFSADGKRLITPCVMGNSFFPSCVVHFVSNNDLSTPPCQKVCQFDCVERVQACITTVPAAGVGRSGPW